MNRNTRTIVVLAIAVAIAALASYGVYGAIKSIPVREVEVAHTFVVAASHQLPAGARVTEADVKLVPWPEKAMLPGSFDKIEQVVNRGVVVPVLENEPIAEGKLTPVEAGAGLTPVIPPGMRAISVRVNEVVGVAGFVTPGTRVDVMVTLKQQDGSSLTNVVVSNVTVLTAGTKLEQDQDKNKPQAMPSSVVTLLVSPEDAEKVVLASNDGSIMLALRNPLDLAPTETQGTRTAALYGNAPKPVPAVAPAPRKTPPPPPPQPVAAPPPPPKYSIEAIRGAKRTEEVLP
jgi:pilus assembly protein CpaB